jgi:hypothetical protein
VPQINYILENIFWECRGGIELRETTNILDPRVFFCFPLLDKRGDRKFPTGWEQPYKQNYSKTSRHLPYTRGQSNGAPQAGATSQDAKPRV